MKFFAAAALSLHASIDAFAPISTTQRRSTGLNIQEKDFNIDGIMDEAEAALLAAEAALEEAGDSPKSSPAPIAKNSDPLDPSVASTIGAFGVGALAGGIAEMGFDAALFNLVGDAAIVPLVVGAGLATAVYASTQKDDEKSKLIKNTLGKATNSAIGEVNQAAERAAQSAVEEVQAVPGKIAGAAKAKVDETVDEIKAVPGKVAVAAKNKVDETAEEIRQIPGKAAVSAKKKAEEVVKEVKATPGRVASSTKKAVENKIDETKTAIQQATGQFKP